MEWVFAIIVGVVTALLVNEIKVHSPWICRWIVRFAVNRAPQDRRNRLIEEWSRFVDETPGVIAKLWVAVGFIRAAYQIRFQERNRLAETEISQITEMAKALENARDQAIAARDHAVAANRAKSEYVACLSHELRTPLNAIVGFSDMLMNGVAGKAGDAKQLEYCKNINESGRHMLVLLNDILDLAKVEAGKLDLHERIVDVERFTTSCTTLITKRVQEGGLTLRRNIPNDIPALRADECKLKQILLNLLSNAVKFTPNGGSVSLTARIDADRCFAFEVADTGIGIAREDMCEILAPFAKVNSDLSQTSDGAGLGLTLTKNLVELHGGILEVESEVGTGTTVTVRFPAGRIVGLSRDI